MSRTTKEGTCWMLASILVGLALWCCHAPLTSWEKTLWEPPVLVVVVFLVGLAFVTVAFGMGIYGLSAHDYLTPIGTVVEITESWYSHETNYLDFFYTIEYEEDGVVNRITLREFCGGGHPDKEDQRIPLALQQRKDELLNQRAQFLVRDSITERRCILRDVIRGKDYSVETSRPDYDALQVVV